MRLLGVEFWPLWCAFALMAWAAVVNARTLLVPNWLTLPAVLVGWLAATAISSVPTIPSLGGGILGSLAATGVGFALLVPFFLMGGLGAGCVKMQAAFGAWIGCALAPAQAATLMVISTLAGGVLAVVVAAVAMRSAPKVAQGIGTQLFPAQVPLSIGSVAGVIVALLVGWV